jgi:hypothetical protein
MTYGSFPPWLDRAAIASLGIAVVCASVIALDETRRPQRMGIMYLVWPLTALFGSVLWLAAYFAWGRGARDASRTVPREPPFAAMVFKGASHCGAGCALGDLIAEWTAFAVPSIALGLGWHTLFADRMFAVWILDFIVAFVLGVVFQYFTIKPMRDLSVAGGVIAAVKADLASIAAWQAGMYGVMAIVQFVWFARAYGGVAPVTSAAFWFAMQLAMLGGFVTSFPVNAWLIRAGVKERM